jgi:hypothetical protein
MAHDLEADPGYKEHIEPAEGDYMKNSVWIEIAATLLSVRIGMAAENSA